MYPGASTRECMESGKAEIVKILDGKPSDQQREWDNRIGRLLRPAEPLCYDFSQFERTNGKILNTSSDIQGQRSFGSCASKQIHPPLTAPKDTNSFKLHAVELSAGLLSSSVAVCRNLSGEWIVGDPYRGPARLR
jgi:hypothetical protein